MDAVINSGPREDSTRVGSAGVVRRQAVDLSPFRRVNQVSKPVVTSVKCEVIVVWNVVVCVFFFAVRCFIDCAVFYNARSSVDSCQVERSMGCQARCMRASTIVSRRRKHFGSHCRLCRGRVTFATELADFLVKRACSVVSRRRKHFGDHGRLCRGRITFTAELADFLAKCIVSAFDPEWVFKSLEAIPNVWLFSEPIHGCMASTVLYYEYVFGLPPFQISVNRNHVTPINRVHLHPACFLPAKCRDARVYNPILLLRPVMARAHTPTP